nr:PadR family transcriptional regulator [Lacticaseibacillus hulanensis]
MLKGVLQGCLLIILNDEPSYGYAIMQRLTGFGFGDVPKGTIYPLLLTMERKQLIASTMQQSPDGPERKYYHLTATGQAERQSFIADWHNLQHNVTQVMALEDEQND